MNNMTRIGMWIMIAALFLLADIVPCRAATPDSLTCSFYFRVGDDLLMADYRSNKSSFEALSRWMSPHNIARISRITIVGAASPEGPIEFNRRLATKRAQAVRRYITHRWKITDTPAITVDRQDDYLAAWIPAVANNPNMPRREKVLQILHSDASVATKWANIKLLTGGASQYMERHIFPTLRNAVACIITLKEPAPQTTDPIQSEAKGEATQTQTPGGQATDTIEATQPFIEDSKFEGGQLVVNQANSPLFTPHNKCLKPLFALKTNLLFDAATILNVALEVPIGDRWSVAGEYIFPWWLWEKEQNCLQVISGNVEGKYWFGNRQVRAGGKPRQRLTGWFAGLYAGGGYYDLEWKKKGYQGEFFIAAGLSAGYAHTLNKCGNLRMEYSVGIGYMETRYRRYDAKQSADGQWHLYRKNNGQYTWTGPTRACVSLVWMINGKKKVRAEQ